MRPVPLADEAKSLPPFLSGNRRLQGCAFDWHRLGWISVLAFAAVVSCSGQTVQLVTASDGEGVSQPEVVALPDSPGTIWTSSATLSLDPATLDFQNPGPFDTRLNRPVPTNAKGQPCAPRAHRSDYSRFRRDPCDPYRPFVEGTVLPLTTEQKAYLAFHDITDPFNLLTIVGTSAFTIGVNSHTAFGPGMHGFAYNVGTSFGQDVTGEVLGTFAVCSLFRQDPRYFRMPNGKPVRRVVHAVAHIVVAQGDNGRAMPNYANLITSTAGAMIANQYVPGLATDPASTTERILTGFLTEPIGNLVAEFLPDIASRIHVRVVVVQRLLNKISSQQGS